MTDREKLPSGDVERVAAIVRQGLSVATMGTPSEIAMQIAYNVARAALSAMPDRQAERAAIVAWLRAYKRDDTNWPQVLATAIENGEHLKG